MNYLRDMNSILNSVQQNHVVAPGQKCSNLLHYLLFRPRFGKRPHILETSRAEALDSRELDLQIV
jgi:hypothetical protein